MISIIMIALAAMFNAAMDVVSHHYPRSIFSKYDPEYFNPRISWMAKYVDWKGGNKTIKMWPPTAFSDFWHTAKTLMILSIVLAVVSASIEQYMFASGMMVLSILGHVIVLGVAWNLIFNLFYNRLFMKK